MDRDRNQARLRRPCSLARLETLESRQLLATFTVTNVLDSGAGSLRQAILGSNQASGTSEIDFNIFGAGVQSIALTSPLPNLVNPAIIDATTQPGYAGSPLIELDGANILDNSQVPPTAIPNVNGLGLTGGSSTVKGLAIDRFTGSGILASRDGNTIAANFIGTDPSGSQSLGNGGAGVALTGRNNVVGGIAPGSRNLISANAGSGVYLFTSNGLPTNNLVQGNLIGTDLSGTLDLGNAGAGVDVESSNNVIGGATPGTSNLIAFNGGPGVEIGNSIYASNIIQNRVSGNSIFSNVGLGIDLGNNGVTPPSGGYTFGPNQLQSFPVLTSAYEVAGGTQVEGTITGLPGSTYTIDFYSNLQADQTGYGQGRTPIASLLFTTGATGIADITSTLPITVPAGQYISATATSSSGNTSEFARSLVVATAAQADLQITPFNSSPIAQAGVSQTYSYSILNNGPSNATNVVFVDTLPAGSTVQSANSTQGSVVISPNGTISVAVGSLALGQTATVNLTYTIASSGIATNVATVSATQGDPTPSNNTLTENFQVVQAAAVDLSLYGVANPDPVQAGDPLTYTFVVTNNSPNQATGVVFSDPLPASLAFDSVQSSQGSYTLDGNNLTVNLGTLPGGTNATVTLVVRALTSGPVSNFALIRGNESDPNAINNSTTVYSYVTPAPVTDVAVAITSAPDPAGTGKPYTYAVIVGNPGTANATGVTLTDILPDAAAIGTIKPSQGTYTLNGHVLTVNFGALAIGAVAEVTISIVPGAPGFIVNQASVTADQPELNISNNFDSKVTVVSGQAQAPAVIDQKLTVTNNKITSVVLIFNEGLDPNSASNLLNYKIQDLGSKGSISASGPSAAIASANYDPITRSVTLVLKKGLSIGRFYKVIANGPGAPGLVDLSGNVLDGERNGLQNSIYESLIGRGTNNRPTTLQVGVPAPKPSHTSSKSQKASVATSVHKASTPKLVQKASVTKSHKAK